MNKKEYYTNRINNLNKEVSVLSKITKKLSLIRLALILIGLPVFYIMFSLSNYLGLGALVILIVSFIFVVRKHIYNNNRIEKNKNLIKIFENEMQAGKSKNIFGNGDEYKNPTHEYSSDLDIFGKYSLYGLINRTVTYEGSDILATWLLKPQKNKEKILEKQKVLEALSKKEQFRDEFLNTFFIDEKAKNSSSDIKNWFQVFKYFFTDKKTLKYILYVLSALTITVLIGGFVFPRLWTYLVLLVVINFIISARYKKNVDVIHNHISQQENLFLKYSTLVNHINNEKFDNHYLQVLQEKLSGEYQIAEELNHLSGLIKKLDYRLNFLMSPILNIFLSWDIQCSYSIENWMKKNVGNVPHWLKTIGEFDALLSLSILVFNNPDWIFPDIETKEFVIEAKQIAHPMIDPKNRVANDYSIKGKGNFDIVTGSNMAGKSTFLRTIGINSILALNGCPVCASSFKVSPVSLISYMRIIDSLEDNLSTFHAELERIKSILQYIKEHDNCFLLLDELLRGTNSQDRHVGTVAFLQQVMKNNSSGIIATHDLGLTEMIEKYPDKIRNYNFGVKTKGEELFFDYKLTDGVCSSFNASLLMKKIGIEIEIEI